jgi:hypothetical protein
VGQGKWAAQQNDYHGEQRTVADGYSTSFLRIEE